MPLCPEERGLRMGEGVSQSSLGMQGHEAQVLLEAGQAGTCSAPGPQESQTGQIPHFAPQMHHHLGHRLRISIWLVTAATGGPKALKTQTVHYLSWAQGNGC